MTRHQLEDLDEDPQVDTRGELARTGAALGALLTIRNGWRYVLDPIRVEAAGTSRDTTTIRPKTEDDQDVPPDARLDTPITLAFWVHAAIKEWPTILDRPQHIPQPTTDPDTYPAWTIRMRTTTLDCGNVYAMLDLLTREADRIANWTDPEDGRDYGLRFLTELDRAARAVTRVAWPPKGDRITIGDCPACGRRLRVKAPAWRRVPHPTTDPATYPAWSQWHPDRDRPITCRCGAEHTLTEWHARIVAFEERAPKTAAQLLEIIAAAGYARYKSTAIVRQWSRGGLIVKVGVSERGESLFDPVQVMAALTDREKRRDQAS